MRKAGEGLQLCEEALQRLIDGAPNNSKFIGVKITPSIVSQEAGFGSGYLKKARHKEFIDDIFEAQKKQQEHLKTIPEAKHKDVKAQLEISKRELRRYKRLLEDSLGREMRLLAQVRSLERKTNTSSNIYPLSTGRERDT